MEETRDIHKERCKALKKVRKTMADALHVDIHQTECTYEGKCSGTCPKCKQEEDILNKALLSRVSVAAGVVAVSAGLSGCAAPNHGNVDIEGDVPNTVEVELMGEVEYIPDGDEDIDGDNDGTCTTQESEGDDASTENKDGQEDATTEEIYELEGDVAAPVDEE